MQDQAAAVEALGGVVAARIGGADGFQAGLHDAFAQRGDGGFLRQAQAVRLARAWVAVDSEAWAAPGIQDRVSARRGWTGQARREGRFGLFA